MPLPRHHKGHRLPRDARCRACESPLAASAGREACDSCLAAYHADCWVAAGGCPSCAAPTRVRLVAPARPPAAPGSDAALELAPLDAEEAPGEVEGGSGTADEPRRLGGAARGWRRMPRGLSVRDDGEELVIRRGWLDRSAPAGLVVMAVLVGGAWWVDRQVAGDLPERLRTVALLGVGLAVVALAYRTLCAFLNTTEVRVTRGRLRVRHGPLPWPGNRDLAADALEQLFVWVRHYPTSSSSSQPTEWRAEYSLRAHVRSGAGRAREVTLLGGLEAPEEARFMEWRIEGWLGIEDREVPGEQG